MGKVTGFLDIPRQDGKYRKPKERLKNFKEFTLPLSTEEISSQGARCMDCGIPFCHNMGCPVKNLIPEWNDYVYKNKWQIAYKRLEATNNFPEITGRICPAPCETACVLSINTSPVAIKQIELAIIEYAFKQGWVKPRPPKDKTEKNVAVIGSGPAGLAAAQQLRRRGHTVIVYEKGARPGGILRYGIPNYKLEKWVLDRRLKQLEDEGVKFETSIEAGEDISANYLLRKFDAVLLCTGAEAPRDLEIPGRELEGIYPAMEFLSSAARKVTGEDPGPELISAKGKNVLVIGGGDTGSDCIGTSLRLGAKKVYQYEIMPQPVKWEEKHNPDWPNWPLVLRSSSSHEEGCVREWNILTKSFQGKGGRVNKAVFARIEWARDEKTGRIKFTEIPGSEFSIEVEAVFLAMGFLHPVHSKMIKEMEIELDERGNIKTDDKYQTSKNNIFTAGDAGTGASLVVRAIYHGREAAASVDRYLRQIK